MKNLIKYPKKSFIGSVMLKKIPYDYAVISTNDGKRLILCYSSAVKPITDPYEFSINNILKNNNFRKNPTVMITDGKQLISTNYKGDKKASKKFFDKINAATKWNDKSFMVFEFDGKTWYGTKMVNDSYYIYALYPSASVFTNRKNYIAYGFMLYLIICLILLSIQRHFDKANLKKMQKQLGIINAISTHYSSIMLLHLDDMKLENINTSPFMNKLIDEEKTPRNIFSCICHKYVAPKYRQLLLDFMDFDTIAERLVDNSYLEIEVKDLTGIWYSVIIIPQKSDVNGNVSAVLIATRDVSYVKQAEELSYKDKLTGLHNCNYMESRSREFLNPDNYPVSLIMADCNYLKRTNDNLGHEYGDMLLKRIAGVIREKLPKNCLAMRVGGDEFLIVGMNCPADEVAQIISDIRKGLVEKSDDKLTLSVSFGSYTIENENISFKEAYEQADQAMYRDKQASRIKRG